MVDRLTVKARADYYNPYTHFEWPPVLPDDSWWMSPEFLTVHGTGLVEDEPTLKTLSRWESVNFFSLNIHGIRELMVEVVQRIHTPAFAPYSDFLHHFLGEENEHMWFFAEFCNRYAHCIYPAMPQVPGAASAGDAWADVVVFGRIVIFEEIVDYFNSRMGADRRLPELVQRINRTHHHDESRHVAFGKQFVKVLHDRASAETEAGPDNPAGAQRGAEVEAYLKEYMSYSIRSLYSARAYRDAGLAEPLRLRREAMAHPGRIPFHEAVLARVNRFFVNNGIFSTAWTAS